MRFLFLKEFSTLYKQCIPNSLCIPFWDQSVSDLGKSNKLVDLTNKSQESIKLWQITWMFIFQKYNIYMLSLCKNSNPIKSINKTNQTYRKYISLEKKVEAKHYLRGQI